MRIFTINSDITCKTACRMEFMRPHKTASWIERTFIFCDVTFLVNNDSDINNIQSDIIKDRSPKMLCA